MPVFLWRRYRWSARPYPPLNGRPITAPHTKSKSLRQAGHPCQRLNEKCYEIKKIVGIAFGNPNKKLGVKDRRKEPSTDDVWYDVLGTFADPDDDDDPGGPDRRWVQMEDLGYVSKAAVKAAVAAWETQAKLAAREDLKGHTSAE